MPPISARGKLRDGSMISSATLAAFSKPVMAKKASATPAMTAKIELPSAVNSLSTAEVGIAAHRHQEAATSRR